MPYVDSATHKIAKLSRYKQAKARTAKDVMGVLYSRQRVDGQC